MELSVKDVALRLDVSEPRVRQLIHSGKLRGRRVGPIWMVNSDDVAQLQAQRRRAGRPSGPKRAWGLIVLLSGGETPWLSSSERSQVRSYAKQLNEPSADLWRSMLAGRSEMRPVQAHPAAISRLRETNRVLFTGPRLAAARGFDLVAAGDDQIPECYVPADEWRGISKSFALRASHAPTLILRIPTAVWPFEGFDEVPDAALAADLLNSAEPRAVTAGELRLNDLLHTMTA